MFRFSLLAIPFVGSCGYAAGSFSHSSAKFPEARATIGCLDVAAALTTKSGVPPVLSYSIGNRCDVVATVDLSSVRVRTHEGSPLAVFDPRSELRPLPVEARSVINEQIEYRPTTLASVAGVCLDVGAINGAQDRHQWICVGGEP